MCYLLIQACIYLCLSDWTIFGCMLSRQKLEVSDFTIRWPTTTCYIHGHACTYIYSVVDHVPGVVYECVTVVTMEYSVHASTKLHLHVHVPVQYQCLLDLATCTCMWLSLWEGGVACIYSLYCTTHIHCRVCASFEGLPRALILFLDFFSLPSCHLWVFWLANFSQHQLFSLFSWFASISPLMDSGLPPSS